jgi:hypothetical protein
LIAPVNSSANRLQRVLPEVAMFRRPSELPTRRRAPVFGKETYQAPNSLVSGKSVSWLTFAKFCEVIYLPVCHRKWKASTDMVEKTRLVVHLVRPLVAAASRATLPEGNWNMMVSS